MLYSEELGLPKTDSKRWRLKTDALGSEKWEYLSEIEAKQQPQSAYVKYLLQLPDFEAPKPAVNKNSAHFTAKDAAFNGAQFFSLLQEDSGIFPCQYKGPMFMTIGYVAALYCAEVPIPTPVKQEIIRYIVNSSHPVDGGWGLHEVDKSTTFGTVINYVILRLLGLKPDNIVCQRARRTLHRLGGAVGAPHWGKASLVVNSEPLQMGRSESGSTRALATTIRVAHSPRKMVGSYKGHLSGSGVSIGCKI